MASSRVLPSSSSASPDLPRQVFSPSISELQAGDPASRSLGSMNMDELLRNIYGDGVPTAAVEPESRAAESAPPRPKGVIGDKTADEVWKEISAGRKMEPGGGDGSALPVMEMTLEDFLAKAGAVSAEEVRDPSGSAPAGYAVDSVIGGDRFSQEAQFAADNSILGFGTGAEGGGGGGGRGRGRKRPAMDPVDRAVVQRQKRMIKNRESAARSRERKQAYTFELETLVHKLEEENSRLLKEEEDLRMQRLKQLMENLIPVTESKQPPRALRRTHSMQW